MKRAYPLILTASMTITAVLLTGCQSAGKSEIAQIILGATYPTREQSRQIAVQVIRDETDITATNTASEPLAGRLWLNKWFSIEIPQWAPGQTLTIDLRDVRDQYGGSMRAGGFWATKEPEKLVLAQVQLAGSDELVGLIVAE